MPSSTDFNDWTDFALAVPVVKAEPYWLWLAVSSPDENTGELYSCLRTDNGGFIVKGSATSDPLYLTEKSRAAMLAYIGHKYMDGMDAESWYAMTEADHDDE